MIFKYNSIFNIKLIQSLTKIKQLKILDFGCGVGVWSQSNLNNKNIKKIILYDKNKKLIKILKKKYNQKKITINFNFRDIVKKRSYNIVIMSSVIQYMSIAKLTKLIETVSQNKKKSKKKLFIIITDIPVLPRPFEFVLMPFFNLKRFFFTAKMIFDKEYKKLDFYLHEKSEFKFLEKKFDVLYAQNINDLKYLRYSLILKLK